MRNLSAENFRVYALVSLLDLICFGVSHAIPGDTLKVQFDARGDLNDNFQLTFPQR